MPQMDSAKTVDIEALKAQIDAEIAARLLVEADFESHTHRRGFSVGSLKLLVSMDTASEVVEMPQLFRLPGAPAGIKGLANRYGRVVPVMDLPNVFGSQHDRAANEWLLVCGRGEDAVGIIIDTLPERKKFTQDDEISLSDVSHPIAAYAKAAYLEWQDIWIDLDTEALFAAVFHADSQPV
jgi:chemotaxis signal transduction protein